MSIILVGKMLLAYKVFVPILDSNKIDRMINWCNYRVGESRIDWDWSYADDSDLNSDVYFYFKDSKFATFFALKFL